MKIWINQNEIILTEKENKSFYYVVGVFVVAILTVLFDWYGFIPSAVILALFIIFTIRNRNTLIIDAESIKLIKNKRISKELKWHNLEEYYIEFNGTGKSSADGMWQINFTAKGKSEAYIISPLMTASEVQKYREPIFAMCERFRNR